MAKREIKETSCIKRTEISQGLKDKNIVTNRKASPLQFVQSKYSLGSGHTYIHTHIPIRMKEISRNQAHTALCAFGLKTYMYISY